MGKFESRVIDVGLDVLRKSATCKTYVASGTEGENVLVKIQSPIDAVDFLVTKLQSGVQRHEVDAISNELLNRLDTILGDLYEKLSLSSPRTIDLSMGVQGTEHLREWLRRRVRKWYRCTCCHFEIDERADSDDDKIFKRSLRQVSLIAATVEAKRYVDKGTGPFREGGQLDEWKRVAVQTDLESGKVRKSFHVENVPILSSAAENVQSFQVEIMRKFRKYLELDFVHQMLLASDFLRPPR